MKLIIAILLGVNILFANSIVGSWTMNKSSANKALRESKSELEKFFASIIVRSLHTIKFKKGGSCVVAGKYISRCWSKSGHHYVLYGESGKKEGTVRVLSSKSMKLGIQKNSKQTPMYLNYHKSKATSSRPPKHKIIKHRIYHAGNNYLMFLNNNKYVLVEIDNNQRVSTKDIKALIYKKRNNIHGYSRENGNYIARNGKFYTILMNEPIDVKSSRHIVFKGRNFYLTD